MDREKIKSHAQDISLEMLQVLYKAHNELPNMQGLEEQIYLSGWVLGLINAGVQIAMDNYAKTYQVNTFNSAMFKSWVSEIEKEILEANKHMIDEGKL